MRRGECGVSGPSAPHPAAFEQQPLPEQVVEFQPPMAGDGLHRPIDPGGDLLDQRSLARTRRTGDVQPVALGRGQKRQHVAQMVFAEQVVLAGRYVRVCNVCKTLAYHARRRIDTERG